MMDATNFNKLLTYGDITLLFAGAGALLLVLYYYRTINRLERNILPEKNNWLLPLSILLLLLNYIVFAYRLLTRQGIFQSNFASTEDTLTSILFFAGAIFVLYAAEVLKKIFLKVNREFAAIFENISVGIHTITEAGIVDFASPSFIKLCSTKSNKEVIGKHVSEIPLYHDDGSDVAIQKALKERKPLSMEISVAGDGAAPVKFYNLLATPISVKGDTESGRTLVLLEDITEQRLLDSAKNNFMSIASHEMRTPLTIIRGNASLVREGLEGVPNNGEMMSMITSIEEGAARLMKIVNDFLDVIRLEGGVAKLNLKTENFDILPIVQKVTTELQGNAGKKNIYLKFTPPTNPLPLVEGDKERVEQVVINLTMNAIQYTDHGGVTVAVERDDKFVKLTVTDTGAGIDKDSQRNLFNKFGTASKEFIHSKEYGSGLGLYICKMIADAMKGRVQLDKSEFGIGSTFSFSLIAADKK